MQVKAALPSLTGLLWLGLLMALPAHAQGGHGPIFGLATPTLPEGNWNLDITVMSVFRSEGAFMLRETVRYGITPDLQVNLSIPQALRRIPNPPRSRIGPMMGGYGDVDASVMWRFHRQDLDIGSRFESTLLLSGSYPTDEKRGGVGVGPGMHAAAVTGYVSRTVYFWAGGGAQRYLERSDDWLGDLRYATAVVGWRPPIFMGDYPKPDWRIFIESTAEFADRDQVAGEPLPNSGGTKVLVGPSVLGLYGKWGIAAGLLYPVYQDLNGLQLKEGLRITTNLSYWF